MNRITTGVIVSLLIMAAALAWTTDHYHGNAVKYKSQRDTATHKLTLANATIHEFIYHPSVTRLHRAESQV